MVLLCILVGILIQYMSGRRKGRFILKRYPRARKIIHVMQDLTHIYLCSVGNTISPLSVNEKYFQVVASTSLNVLGVCRCRRHIWIFSNSWRSNCGTRSIFYFFNPANQLPMIDSNCYKLVQKTVPGQANADVEVFIYKNYLQAHAIWHK